MSGGVEFDFYADGTYARKCNKAMDALDPVLEHAHQERTVERALWHTGKTDEALLKDRIEQHFQSTGSTRAKALLENWDASRRQFVKVFPTEYKRALGEMGAKKSKDAIAA